MAVDSTRGKLHNGTNWFISFSFVGSALLVVYTSYTLVVCEELNILIATIWFKFHNLYDYLKLVCTQVKYIPNYWSLMFRMQQ